MYNTIALFLLNMLLYLLILNVYMYYYFDKSSGVIVLSIAYTAVTAASRGCPTFLPQLHTLVIMFVPM